MMSPRRWRRGGPAGEGGGTGDPAPDASRRDERHDPPVWRGRGGRQPEGPQEPGVHGHAGALHLRLRRCRGAAVSTGLRGAPAGYLDVPGFIKDKVYVSFDGGRTWENVAFPGYPRGHADLLSNSDPMVTVAPNGTFFIAWDDLHLSASAVARLGVLDGGIAVSKSTDGGRTWSRPVFTGTPTDRPFLATD